MTGQAFRASSHCQDGGCVGVRHRGNAVDVRDEKNPIGGHLTVGAAAWTRFTRSALVSERRD